MNAGENDLTNNKAFYALVQGRVYEGDIEGKRYHWRKGIPGSEQLREDIETGHIVGFVYYRTWNQDAKRGKYFYGSGLFDNKSFKSHIGHHGKVEYFAAIKSYTAFPVPVIVEESLRKKIWPGGNRQAGIKRISEHIFNRVKEPGLRPNRLTGLVSVVGEPCVESLLNEQVSLSDIKDSEGVEAAKRTVKTEVYKRAKRLIRKLKSRYKGICQITGERLVSSKRFGVDVTEAHHIRYLSKGGRDGTSSNIIIISPEWHRLLHKKNPRFDRERLAFVFAKGEVLPVKYAGHLSVSPDERKA